MNQTNKILIIAACGTFLMQGAFPTGAESLKPAAKFAMTAQRTASSPSQRPATQRATERASVKTQLYGIVTYADNWTIDNTSLQTFRVGYSPVPEKVMDINIVSGYSGDYYDNRFRYMDYSANNAGNITAVNWNITDIESQTTETKPQSYALGVCMDMTTDVTTGKIYGISAVTDALVEIDPETGDANIVANTLPFYTLSADAAGQLYGIMLDTTTGEGVLYTINKLTGNAMKIGSTGVQLLTDASGQYAYYQSTTFSPVDGELYWTTSTSDGSGALYRVNVADGSASYMAAFPNNESIVALFAIPAAAQPGAPAPVSNVSAEAAPNAELKATITFTAPELTASGEPLTDLTALKLFRGSSSEAAYTVDQPEIRETYSWTDTQASAGFNSYRIIAVNADGESTPVYASVFCGHDYPEAPTNVTIALNSDGYPTLSWDAPLKGLSGVDIDPEQLTYSVIRNDGLTDATIAENLTKKSFTDRGLTMERQTYPYYRIIAHSPAGAGRESEATGCYAGPSYPLPFTETFKNTQTSTSPWVLRSLALGGTWELGYVSTFPGSGPYIDEGMLIFIGFRAVDGAEARISTPQLTFEGCDNPELLFHFYYINLEDQDLVFDDRMQIEVSVDEGEFEPVENGLFYQKDANSGWTECRLPLTKYAGEKRIAIGFHGITAGGFDLLLDNIRVCNGESGSVESVTATTVDDKPVYYNLQGIRIDSDTLLRGIYIRRCGQTTEKIIVQ